jgi:hypothetical protein
VRATGSVSSGSVMRHTVPVGGRGLKPQR